MSISRISDEPYDERDEDPGDDIDEPGEPGICPACNGSGEGQHEGTRCYRCRGSGEC